MGQNRSYGIGKTAFYHSQENMTHSCPNYKVLKKTKSLLCMFMGYYFRTSNNDGDFSFSEHAPSFLQVPCLTGGIKNTLLWVAGGPYIATNTAALRHSHAGGAAECRKLISPSLAATQPEWREKPVV